FVARRTDEPSSDELGFCRGDRWRSPMGRFYFHLRVDGELQLDEEGQDFPDVSAARHEAVNAARELLALAVKAGEEPPDAFVIADEHGREIDTVPLPSVLPRALRK